MTPDAHHQPSFQSEQHAEWRIRNGDVLVLRYDRQTGEWAGEREQPDESIAGQLSPRTLTPQEAQVLARGHDLRFRDGCKPT
jgi:hypothetical protein